MFLILFTPADRWNKIYYFHSASQIFRHCENLINSRDLIGFEKYFFSFVKFIVRGASIIREPPVEKKRTKPLQFESYVCS